MISNMISHRALFDRNVLARLHIQPNGGVIALPFIFLVIRLALAGLITISVPLTPQQSQSKPLPSPR